MPKSEISTSGEWVSKVMCGKSTITSREGSILVVKYMMKCDPTADCPVDDVGFCRFQRTIIVMEKNNG